jgi:hypothetical protein
MSETHEVLMGPWGGGRHGILRVRVGIVEYYVESSTVPMAFSRTYYGDLLRTDLLTYPLSSNMICVGAHRGYGDPQNFRGLPDQTLQLSGSLHPAFALQAFGQPNK